MPPRGSRSGGNSSHVRPTEMSTLLSGVHGRERRSERRIEKVDLQRARRYGMEEPAKKGRLKYTYGGIVFIYDPVQNREITSYSSSDKAGKESGTKFAQPIQLNKKDETDQNHEDLTASINSTPQRWTSHSVLVVDMSGSMRRDDVNGGRCRSDGVWMALARDYIMKPLQKTERNETDLVSIILMRDEAEIIIEREPTTWTLYNKLVDMREWSTARPWGAGNYLPALEAADGLLSSNANAGCSLSLLFFSDGRPSDRGDFAGVVGGLASKFGRRLSLTCIGMAEASEDFSTLNDMVTEAQSYGAVASFGKPSLDADSLSNIVTTLASSLTTSKTEMSELKTGTMKEVRMDVTREKRNTPDYEGDWTFHESNDPKFKVNKIMTWSHRSKSELGFVDVVDPRCAGCHKHVGYQMSATRGIVCSKCNAFCICYACHERGIMDTHTKKQAGKKAAQCDQFLIKTRSGELIRKELPSFDIAIKQNIFAEGAERVVRKVRFLKHGEFHGPAFVAKDSRFIEKHDNYRQRRDYHRTFLRTQNIAQEYAKKFNECLDKVEDHFPSRHHQWLRQRPRIEFIEPFVIEVKEKGHRKSYLVEKMLDGEYQKYNNNMGYVEREARQQPQSVEDESQVQDDLIGQMANLGLDGLGAIEEGSEEEDSDEGDPEEEGLVFDSTESAPDSGTYRDCKDSYFPQAFSHFTYVKSKKHFMVVDLQGVFTTNADGTCCYELTDPVIHRRGKRFRHWSFGRTDRGKKGIQAFLRTHQCTDVCRLLGLPENDLFHVE